MSNIEWTDTTWNPVVGCTQPDRLTEPLRWRKPRRVSVCPMGDLFDEAVPFDFIDRVSAVMALCPKHTFLVPTKRPERMAEYWASRGYGGEWTDNILHEVERMGSFSEAALDAAIDLEAIGPLPNVWLGTSVEDQARADERIPHLLRCPAAVRFLSCEPLLGAVDLVNLDSGEKWPYKRETSRLDALRGFASSERDEPEVASMGSDGQIINHGRLRYVDRTCGKIDWVIVGGESGPNARPCDVAWIRSIVRQCKDAGVPCFVKQLGARPYIGGDSNFYTLSTDYRNKLLYAGTFKGLPDDAIALGLRNRKGADPAEWPDDLRVRKFPQAVPS